MMRTYDCVYAVRFTHNVEAIITGFSLTRD